MMFKTQIPAWYILSSCRKIAKNVLSQETGSMTRQEWYVFGFVLTVVGAIALWAMAVLIYRKNRQSLTNKVLAWDFVFVGLWILCGFAQRITAHPIDAVILWDFRLANLFGNSALLLTVFFVLTLNSEKRPRRLILIIGGLIWILMVVVFLTPLGVRSSTYQETGVAIMKYGPLYPLIALFFATGAVASLWLAGKKLHAASGIDRARTSIIFYSLAIVFPMIGLCTYILPAITSDTLFADYAFLVSLAVLPAASFYAIARYRLLEVQIIVRRSGLILIGLIAFSLPLLLLFVMFYLTSPSLLIMGLISASVLLPLFILAPTIWNYLERVSARIFFSGLYDSDQLEVLVSSRFGEAKDQVHGIFEALREIAEALGLLKIELVTSPHLLAGKSLFLGCYRDQNEFREEVYGDYDFPEWLSEQPSETQITEELARWGKAPREKALAATLQRLEFSACVPCKTATRDIGYLLVGNKRSRNALSVTDISFLERVGLRFGLYLDNYALATDLLLKVEALAAANEYKKEIIAIMAHEFRTPITVAAGVAQLLAYQEEFMDAEQKATCFSDLQVAMGRLVELVAQAFQISEHQQGKLLPKITEVELSILTNRLFQQYGPDKKNRLFFELPANHCILPTDVEYLFIILKNIIDNALYFSPEDSPVNIKVQELPDCLIFEVQDFGRGIPEEEIQNIFDPFTRIEKLEHHNKGAGLGLYVAKLYADQLKIRINVESTMAVGTRVTLEIPEAAKNSGE